MSTVVRVEEEAFPASFGYHGVVAQLEVSRIRKEGGQVAPVVVWEVLLPVCEQNVSLPVLAVCHHTDCRELEWTWEAPSSLSSWKKTRETLLSSQGEHCRSAS